MSQLNDYKRLVALGDSLKGNTHHWPTSRIAVLAEHAPQKLVSALKGSFFECELFAEVWEADYDTLSLNIFDDESELYSFKPDFVVLSLCVQKFRDKFFQSAPSDRESLSSVLLEQLMMQTEKLLSGGFQVIINTLALPVERQFGSYSVKTRQSLYRSVLAFNLNLIELASKNSQVHLNDIQYFSSCVGTENFFDEKVWALSKYPCANRFLPGFVAGISKPILALKGRMTKVLVLDLDNTLWGGVIGDDGLDGIVLSDAGAGEGFQRFQRYLKTLKERGVVLTVCSKNEMENALLPFQKHPSMILKESDIAVFMANWEPKSQNIKKISEVLNLGMDSFVFLDDSAFERGEVRAALPMVTVPELSEDVVDFASQLERLGVFETVTFSKEDIKRAESYQEEAKRIVEQNRFTNIDEYLKSLKMVADVVPFNERNVPRIAQLIQRSNQFNLRTQRISESRCREMMHLPQNHFPVSISIKDKFGDYGLILAICSEVVGDSLDIIEWVMSCRVLKRGVEELAMNTLFAECKKRGIQSVHGEYITSKKNSLVKEFYDRFGFKRVSETENGVKYRLNVKDYEPRKVFISLEPSLA